MEVAQPVLIAEDDLNDQVLFQHAFREAGVTHPVILVEDGQEAINYLSGRPGGSQVSLVLTDLKMPRCSGFDLLAWFRSQEHLRSVPILVVTGSCDEADREQSLELGAHACFTKPAGFGDLVELARQINITWLSPHSHEGLLAA